MTTLHSQRRFLGMLNPLMLLGLGGERVLKDSNVSQEFQSSLQVI